MRTYTYPAFTLSVTMFWNIPLLGHFLFQLPGYYVVSFEGDLRLLFCFCFCTLTDFVKAQDRVAALQVGDYDLLTVLSIRQMPSIPGSSVQIRRSYSLFEGECESTMKRLSYVSEVGILVM